LVRRGVEGLAFNARRRDDFDGAAAIYREGMELLPEEGAYFHFALGLNWVEGERPHRALEHFAEAARLSPREYGGRVKPHVAKLRRDPPGCLFPAPRR